MRSRSGTGLRGGRRKSHSGEAGLGPIIIATAVGVGRSIVGHRRIGLRTSVAVAGCSAASARSARCRRSGWVSASVNLYMDIGVNRSSIDDRLDQTCHLHLGIVGWKEKK